MKDKPENLQIVVLESPFDTWGQVEVEKYYLDMIGLKLRGYGAEYPYGVLPVDGADLISTHFLLCRKEPGKSLRQIMGIRWTSMKKCRLHYLNFPGLSLLQQAGATEHVDSLQEVIRSADARSADLYYSGSLSIEPEERGDKVRSLMYREILTCMYVAYFSAHQPAELMAGGTVRFKIDAWLKSLGHSALQKDGLELAPIEVRHLAGEVVRVMHMKEFSFEARQIAKKWQHLWEQRLHITAENAGILKKAG